MKHFSAETNFIDHPSVVWLVKSLRERRNEAEALAWRVGRNGE